MRDSDDVADTDDDQLFDSLISAKCLADAEGRLAPVEVETMLSGSREKQKRMFRLEDPLEQLGRRYMVTAAAFLSTRNAGCSTTSLSFTVPTPIEVFSWFHAFVPARIFRALLSEIDARDGIAGRHDDTLATAKLALVGIDRSLTALAALRATDDDPRLELLITLLQRLAGEVERRFPGARAYQRHGLDGDEHRSDNGHRSATRR